MLIAIIRGAGSAATIFHLRPAGNPAPPRPRRPESSIAATTSSRVLLPLRQAAASSYPPLARYAWYLIGSGVTVSFIDFVLTSAATFYAVARGTGFCPTTATGAVSQRPTQGACSTRTSFPSTPGSVSSSERDPARSHEIESQTRTVIAGGAASPSFTTSKW